MGRSPLALGDVRLQVEPSGKTAAGVPGQVRYVLAAKEQLTPPTKPAIRADA
jgi:hypothetical protein